MPSSDELLPALPAIALEGAERVGKTATAQRRARTVTVSTLPARSGCSTFSFDRALEQAPSLFKVVEQP